MEKCLRDTARSARLRWLEGSRPTLSRPAVSRTIEPFDGPDITTTLESTDSTNASRLASLAGLCEFEAKKISRLTERIAAYIYPDSLFGEKINPRRISTGYPLLYSIANKGKLKSSPLVAAVGMPLAVCHGVTAISQEQEN